jgi:hypothetical protein
MEQTLCWRPTKLAEWIGENLQDELGLSDKADSLSEPGSSWTPAELNHILQALSFVQSKGLPTIS